MTCPHLTSIHVSAWEHGGRKIVEVCAVITTSSRGYATSSYVVDRGSVASR